HAGRNLEAPCTCLAFGRQSLAASAGIRAPWKLLAGAGTTVHEVLREELVEGRLVTIQMPGLPRGRFVPVHVKGSQLGHDDLIRSRHDARCIDVLDAQQPFAVMRTRIEEACHRGKERAVVQWAGGTRCEAPYIRTFTALYFQRHAAMP